MAASLTDIPPTDISPVHSTKRRKYAPASCGPGLALASRSADYLVELAAAAALR
ncbi:MAG: hypothetical protein ACREE9_18000 [Stellaceae bacterium]